MRAQPLTEPEVEVLPALIACRMARSLAGGAAAAAKVSTLIITI